MKRDHGAEVVRVAQEAMHTATVQGEDAADAAAVAIKKCLGLRFASTNTVKTFDTEDPPSAVSRDSVVAVKEPTAFDLIEKDFMVETVAKKVEVAPAAAAAVDFSSFLGDVADAWEDEMEDDTA